MRLSAAGRIGEVNVQILVGLAGFLYPLEVQEFFLRVLYLVIYDYGVLNGRGEGLSPGQ